MSDEEPDFIRNRKAWMVAAFERYSARRLRKEFHQVRLTSDSYDLSQIAPATPIILFGNHSSWWDPLLALFLRRRLFPARTGFAPIDADMLEQYGIFKPLGFFGVDRSQPQRAARQFLRDARVALSGKDRLLFLTPQGRFADARERPVLLESGLAHLIKRQPGICALPMAVEYTFWEESQPEILLHLSEPVKTDAAVSLERAQDHLAELSVARATDRFTNLLEGSSGANPVYDLWQRLRGKNTRHSDL